MNIHDLHDLHPFAEPDPLLPERIEGWNSDEPAFAQLIGEVRPELIVEVGTWFGASALHMAKCLEENRNAHAKIVCVDTWLGSLEFWLNQTDPQRYRALGLKNGYPTAYYQFLANVIHQGRQDVIIPFPQASLIAARWFVAKGIKADLIYIDASHDCEDVLADIRAWSKVLRPGGVIFGDDWNTWPDTQRAVKQYMTDLAHAHGCHGHYFEANGNKWIIRTPVTR